MDSLFYHYDMFLWSLAMCILNSISFDTKITILTPLWLLFVWYIFFLPFTLFVPLSLKQLLLALAFLSSLTICFLRRMVSSILFNVNLDNVEIHVCHLAMWFLFLSYIFSVPSWLPYFVLNVLVYLFNFSIFYYI